MHFVLLNRSMPNQFWVLFVIFYSYLWVLMLVVLSLAELYSFSIVSKLFFNVLTKNVFYILTFLLQKDFTNKRKMLAKGKIYWMHLPWLFSLVGCLDMCQSVFLLLGKFIIYLTKICGNRMSFCFLQTIMILLIKIVGNWERKGVLFIKCNHLSSWVIIT